MRRPVPLVLAVLLALLCLPREAFAFRCGNRLVTEGDSAAEVIARCGDPVQVDRRAVLRPAVVWRYGRPWQLPGGPVEKVVETWTFNLGPNQFMRQVTIEDGIVKAIRTLGYGYQ
ncbi:MAG: DUF2845 domain-containing protein [Steroidobacteraceae bacterium]